jgi:nucleoid-associated protein YgaU
MGGGFKLAGHHVSYSAAVIGIAAVALLLLLKRKASQPTVLTTSSVGGMAMPGSPLSGPGIISSAPSLAGAGAPFGPSSSGAGRTYVTGQGDTLSGIAARLLGNYQLAPALASMNSSVSMDPNNITPGTLLQLPPATASMPGAQLMA